MPAPGNKISEEVIEEVRERLNNGESPEEIKEDDEMPSRRKIYDIKSDMEEEQERQAEMEKEVFRDENDANREDIVDVLNQAGVGVTQEGKPKAKVEKALNAIDFDSAWDDPHYVANTLESEAGMKREWANRVVRKAYGMPDFPYVEQPGSEKGVGAGPGRGRARGSGGQQRQPATGQQGAGQQYQGQQPHQQPQSGNQGPDSQVRQEMQELRQTVSELAEAVASEDDDSGSDENMVEIEQGEKTMRVPYHVAVSQGLLGGGDDKDFMEKLREAKQQGIIPSREDFEQDDGNDIEDTLALLREFGVLGDDDGDDKMAEAIGSAIESLGEKQMRAQQQMSENFSNVLSEIRDMQEDEDDGDEPTAEEIVERVTDELKEDEVDRLQREMDERFSEVMQEVKRANRSTGSGKQSEEFLKTDREMEFREKQLDTLNQQLQTIPEKMANSIRDGLVPAMKELQHGGGSSLWNPPQGQNRGEPAYSPEGTGQSHQQRRQQRQQQQRRQQRQQARQSSQGQPDTDAQSAGYPDTGRDDASQSDSEMAQDEPQNTTEQDARDVRQKLGLDDGEGTDAEVTAS